MIKVDNITLTPGESEKHLPDKVCRKLHIRQDQLLSLRILRRSVDARKGRPVRVLYSLACEVKGESRHKGAVPYRPFFYRAPESGTKELSHPPVIVGAGPCGLFAAWLLAKQGYRPILLERGKCVEERQKALTAFWETGVFDPYGSASFGEGGAGTFSDGKLYTSVKDPSGRGREILRIFVSLGAPEEILYDSAPHLGTDVLFRILQEMRKQLLAMGAEIRFSTQMTELVIRNKRLSAVKTKEGAEIPCEVLVLSIGHSARDTFVMLKEAGLPMEQKPFAMGFRVEHPQALIDQIQYREAAGLLPPASYHLSHTTKAGRGVYSFCMCPGGYVINAASEEQSITVNGMSYSGRGSQVANSAIIVQVSPTDYDAEKPYKGHPVLKGISLQRRLEHKAWELGNDAIPQQLFGDYKQNKESTAYGAFSSRHKGAAAFSNLRGLLLPEMEDAFLEGMADFGKKLPGFDRADTVLSGIEARTSSPVRILRNERLETEPAGIYPAGEGAGYAGGIVSAAMDGMRTAEEIIRTYERPKGND